MKIKNLFVFFVVMIGCSLKIFSEETKIKDHSSSHFLVRGDVLYWIPEISGLDVNFGTGSIEETTSGGITTTVSIENDTDPAFNWNFGYRLGLGWDFDDCDWTIEGLWTDFSGTGKKSVNAGNWKVELHQLEVSSLYQAHFSSIDLQPFIGLRAASIYQKLNSQVMTTLTIDGDIGTDTRTFRDKQQFYGVGPLFGLNSGYHLSRGFSFYGDFAFALFYGTYQLKFNDQEIITAPATPSQTESKIKKTMRAFDFNLDLALGVQWKYLLEETGSLTMQFGFENHQYFDQSRLGYGFGNLAFSGFVYSMVFAF